MLSLRIDYLVALWGILALVSAGCSEGTGIPRGHPAVTSGPQLLDRLNGESHVAETIASAHRRTAVAAPVERETPNVGSHGRRAKEALESREFEQALEEIRLEIGDARGRPTTYQAEVRALALGILGKYQRFRGFSDALDAEAEGYYREGLRLAAGDEALESALKYRYATYLSNTGRNGAAIPYMRAEFEYWKRSGNAFQIAKSLDALANAHDDMGDLTMRDHYRQEALTRARGYFHFPDNPADPERWRSYERFLFHAATDATLDGKADEVQRLWAQIRPIADRFNTVSYRSYLEMAELLGAAGVPVAAANVLEEAERRAADRRNDPHVRADLACTRAVVDLWANRINEATGGFDLCFTDGNRGGNPGAAHLAGLAFEKKNDFARAVSLFEASTRSMERTRESYSVAERAAFFRGAARKPYWGLIRVAVRRAARSGADADFLGALSTSELVRARQFGDRMDPNTKAAVSTSVLAEFRRFLRADEVVLDYLLTDTAIIVFGFTRDEFTSQVIEYDPRQFSSEIRTVAELLASSRSSATEITTRMAALGHKTLDPVARLLSGKRRIVVLPDGDLNLVPFDLLGDPANPQRPLLERFVVRTAPSLRFMARTRTKEGNGSGTGFIAVADPEYGEQAQVAGVRLGDLGDTTRGIGFSDYFEQLPESRSEVERIAALVGKDRARLVLGKNATEGFLKSADLRGYRFVHLAMHGIIGGEVPTIGEPALVMAAEQGQDGFLTASEAAGLKLGAELTVLSACKTGRGEYVTGEGVMGMSRAFLLAGSRAVAVSLWDVDSAATEALMVAFYRQLLTGSDPDVALHDAKLELLGGVAQPREQTVVLSRTIDRRHPFYWSGFVVVGG